MKRINEDQIDCVRRLWKCVSQIGAPLVRERRLRAFCERVIGVSDPLLLTREQGDKVIKNLKNRLKKQNATYAQSAKILLHGLSARKREILRKECPFHKDRNKLIRLLRSQGVSRVLLAKVSGLGPTSIHNILKKGMKKGGVG
jgi:hypothetical protein